MAEMVALEVSPEDGRRVSFRHESPSLNVPPSQPLIGPTENPSFGFAGKQIIHVYVYSCLALLYIFICFRGATIISGIKSISRQTSKLQPKHLW